METEDEAGSIQDSATSVILGPAAFSPETGDFTSRHAAVSSGGNELADETDPISEADLFLTFGRDEQAEEILKEALNKNPGFHKIHLKLLSIYANRKDANAFSAIARQLQDSGDTAAWEQAVVLGRKLEPNNPMYGGTGSAAPDQGAVMGVVPVATPAAAPASADMGLAFTLDFPSADNFAVAPEKVVTKEIRDIGLGEINLNLDESFAPPTPSPIHPAGDETTLHEDIATKLDLAKAYQEMGDSAGAREILEEVVRDGDVQQRAEAEALMQQLP